MSILSSDTTFLQGNTVSFTFDSNTSRTACISCLKLYSKLSLYPNSLPPSHIISILFIILGSFFIARATFVIAPIANIYVFLFFKAISIILLTAGLFSVYPF